jgi:hypothetical protein
MAERLRELKITVFADGRITEAADVILPAAALLVTMAEAIPEWKPIETAPKDGSPIIVSGGIAYWRERLNHWEGPAAWYTITGVNYPGSPIQWEVRHWMPLPAPPATEGEKG